ncbi:hypothetical protein STAS_00679 [Striga asiatica]|uniref:Uncharacterized protein n=1 Tax=Striga asiatica TaxID=4170 RepID=A0A5A7NX89_STRAF|nr:hypothetical protein STAS_00679 [Striga asiatica]
MGTQISRPTRAASTRHPPPPPLAEPPARTVSNPNPNPDAPIDDDISSYEAACRADPDLRTLDSSLQLRTSRAISSIAVGLETRSLSLDSLSEVTECLLEMNQEVVKIVLQNKRDVWKNKELFDLVDDYFDNSLLTMDFCASLDACLQRAAGIESAINLALRRFEEEHSAEAPAKDYSRTLEELRNFRGASDPFAQEFFKIFSSVYARQSLTLENLQAKKRKLDRKLGKLKAWRRVSNVIFVVTFASVLICSVVAAAVAAPPVVTALAAAAAVPLGSMGKWLNSLWQKWERDLRGQREIISSMQIGTYIVLKDLDSIRVLVDRFQIKIEDLLANADFAANGDESAVVVAVKEIREKAGDFFRTIHDLKEHASKCTQETRMARTLILRRIINHPSESDRDIGMFS